MKKFILSLFLCCVSVFSFATTYYSISASGGAVDATLLSSWTNNASGVGGTAPASFTAAGNSWVAQTSAGLTVSHTWSLLGSLQVGCPLTITSTASLSGAITVNSGGTLTFTTGGTFSPTADLTNNGTLVISSGTTLNMGTYAISGTGSFTNNGTITTASTSSTPLPSGVSWGGTVQYTASLLQILIAGTYNNLSVKGCSASGDITVTGNFTTASSYSVDMASNALSVAGTITNAGIIKTSNVSSTPLPTGKSWSGTVNYYGNGQTVVAGTYATLSLSTSSGSVTASAGGNIKVTSAFTSTALNTLDMGTNVLSGTPATLTNGGILITAVPTSVSSTPIINKPWGGTVIYNGVTQTIIAQTYNNLSSTGAGTNTAGGALTVSGLLTIGSGNTLKMSANNLSVGSVSNSGTVQTSGSNSITKTIPWGGTVQYSSLSGGQVVNGTYSNLTLSNTTGTNTAHGNIVVTGNLTTTAGGTLDMTTYYTLNVSSATINNNGTIKTGTPTSISASPITPGMVWGGTIQYSTNGAYVTAVAGTYNNLTISTGVHAGGNITVNGALNVTSYLYLGNFVLDGSLTSITIVGTLETSVPTTTSSVPLPINRAWTGGGNILYDAPLGGQTIVAGTYDNLKIYTTGSGSTANTAGGDLTINNNLYAPYTGTLDLTSYVLKGSFSTHYGAATIKTQNTSVHPIPSNIYIGFNFQYNNSTGGQTIVPGTYATLTNSNTSGVNTLSGSVSVSGNCSLSAGSNLNNNGHDMALTRNLLGSGTETGSGTITLNGNDSTIYTIGGVTVSNLSLSIPTPTRTKGQYYLGGNLTVTNTLTLGANLDLDSNNLILPVGASLAGSFSNQTMLITCCSGLVQQYKNGTGSLTFPVGDSFYNYTPIVIDLTGGTFTPGSSYVGVNVSNTKNPSNANTTNYLNRYWDVVTSGITSPVYDLTSAQYLVGDITGTESSINTGQYTGSLPWVRFDAANTGTHQLTGTGLSGSNTAITGLSSSNPTVSASPSSITICNGSSTVLTVAASTGDPTLSYSWAPGATLSASTGSSVTASPISNQVYTLTVTDGNGNTATSTCTVNIDNIPNVGTVNGSGITCPGNLDSVTDVTADAGGTWLSSTTSVATVDPVTGYITGVAQGISTISYSFTNTCGTYAATAIETITAPTAITGTQYVCVGLTTTLSSSPSGNTWSSSNTGVATVDAFGVVTGVSGGTAVISYAVNASPCFVTAIVTVNALPVVTFSSAPGANTCASANVTYTTQAGQSNYIWTVPGVLNTDYTVSSGGTSTTDNTVTLQWLTTGSQTVTINYSNSHGCTAVSATSNSTTVNSRPSVTFTTSPGANVCSSTDVTYTTQAGQSNYVWSVPGILNTDYTITSGGISSTDNTVTLQWLTAGSQTVTVNYNNSNGCNALSATSSTTNVNARPTVTFTSSPGANTCASSSVIYTTQASESNYLWSVPGVLNTDYTISSGGVSTSDNTVTLQWLTAGSKTVTINYTDGNTCTALSATSSNTTVHALPSVTFTASPGANTCVSSDVAYTTQSSESSYIWSVSGSLSTDYTISSGGTSTSDNTVTLQWLTTGSQTVTINYTDGNGCTALSSTSNSTTVNARPTPTFTVSPGANTCSSVNVTYTTQSGQSSYVWSVPGVLNTDYTIISGGVSSTDNTVTLQWLTSGSKTVTVNYNNSNSCNGLSAASSTTNVNTSPSATFTASPGANSCASNDIVYTTQSGQTNYIWSVPGVLNTDYTISSGGVSSTDNTVTLQWLTTGSKTITVNYSNSSSCSSIANASNTTSVHALPVVTFTSAPGANTCASNNVTYTTQSSEPSYAWAVPGVLNTDYTISSGGVGSGSNTVTLQWLTPGSQTVTINYTDANGCTALSATSNNTTVHALPIVSFTSSPGANICTSNDVTYTTQSSESSYVWGVPGVLNTDYTISSGGLGSGSNTVTLQWLTSGSKSVTINYTDANGCTALSATTNTTSVNTIPTVTFTSAPGANTCASNNVTYTTQSGESSYVWSVPGVLNTDYTISSGGVSSTDHTVTLQWLTASSQTVTINYTNAGGCTALSPTSNTTSVHALPVVTFTSSPGANICASNNVTYTTQSGQSSYVWSVPGVLNTDYTISSGGVSSTDNTVTLQWLTSGSQTVTINYTNSNSCTALSATSNTTSVHALPVVTFTSAPGANTCASNNVTYTTQSGQSSYVWSVPGVLNTDYTISSGGVSSTDNTVTLQWLTAGSKTVTINYTNSNSCIALSATSNTTSLHALPVVTFTSTPGANTCASNNVTYTTQSSEPSYAWSVPGVLNTDYTISSGGVGSGSNTVTLQWLTPGSQTVTINYTDANGCTALSATSNNTTVHALPVVTFTSTPGVNTCASATVTYTTQSSKSSYVWNVPGTLSTDYTISSGGIGSGSNTVTLQWLTAGSKSVTINYTDANSCTALSPTSNTTSVHALPVVTFTSSAAANTCASNNVTYTTQSSESGYVWSVPGVLNTDYTISSGGTGSGSNTVTLQWLTAGSKSVTINYTDANSCTALSSTSNTTSVHLLPVVSFTTTPTSNTCASNNVTYATQSGESSYVWSVPGVLNTDYTISSGGTGSGSNTVTLKWLTAGSKSVTINYTDANSCTALSSTSNSTTVHALPGVSFTSTPASTSCASNNVTYTTQSGQSSYVWNVPGTLSTDYTISSGGIGSGSNTVTLKWLTAGSKAVTINYSDANNCTALSATSNTTTVNALPVVSFVSPPTAKSCLSTNYTYQTQSSETSYVWNVSGVLNTDYTVSSGGTTSGSNTVTLQWLTTGSKTVTINYTDANGCTALAATIHTTSVNPLPNNISCNTLACVGGATITASDVTTGGTWSSSNSSATINSSSGVISGISAGFPTIDYTLSTGCFKSFALTVRASPSAISGITTICPGATLNLTDVNSGGTWVSSTTSVATIGSSSGIVSGITSGTTTITYTYLGCTTTQSLTVSGTSISPITGTLSLCNQSTTSLADATGSGSWSSGNTAIATVDVSTGVVTGVAPGNVAISYSASGCFSVVTTTVNVPASITYTGSGTVCSGNTLALSDATNGGTWLSTATSVATINGSGVVTPVSTGPVTISYTKGSCSVTTALSVSNNPLSAISAPSGAVCNGNTMTLSDTYVGGVWSSNSTGIATIGSSNGVIATVSPGSVTFLYTESSCYVSKIIFVGTPLPSITGSSLACIGQTTSLSNTTSGGSWYSSTTLKATVGTSTGVVTGVATGTVTISYALTGCTATLPMTVNSVPASITGTASLCASGSTTLHDVTAGGTWSSSNAGLATVDASTGVVSGAGAGNPLITYTVTSTGCYSTVTLTVNPCRFGNEISNGNNNGINEYEQNYVIYPNPSTGQLNFVQSIIDNVTIPVKIVNYVGAIVYDDKIEFSGGNVQLNLNNAIPGIYLVEISISPGTKQVFKLVIEK